MRICVAQLRSTAGDIAVNTQKHLELIEFAVSYRAQFLCFPELSLTGYEPELAKSLALEINDSRLVPFQKAADASELSIAVGLPIPTDDKPQISLVIFQPRRLPIRYAKQLLHEDELPYFAKGKEQLLIQLDHCRAEAPEFLHRELQKEEHVIAPAICYESLQESHAKEAAALQATMYLASVAKPERSVSKAYKHYPAIAQAFGMTVLMANCIGPSDNFVATGQSAVWNAKGDLLAQLDQECEGIVLYDTSTEEALAIHL